MWLWIVLVTLAGELDRHVAHCQAPRVRSMREFAEQEIVIPDGPFSGRTWRAERQPMHGLWIDAIDSRRWTRHLLIADVQSGKTFAANVIPVLYHLFELGQKVVYGVPQIQPMGRDKWTADLLPAIACSRFRDLLPKRGAGSREGFSDEVAFCNGAALKFMAYTGEDSRRSGYTAPIVVLTEMDKGDTSRGVSRETDPITQCERRSRAYAATGEVRIYGECTVSVPGGRIWQEYCGDREHDERVASDAIFSTESEPWLPCPHCEAWVRLRRENLAGWEGCRTKIEARKRSQYFCPSCAEGWSLAQWRAANVAARLVSRGQEITPAGRVTGQVVETDTFGMRITAANNLFVAPADIGATEWSAARTRGESAKKDLLQFWWSQPYRDAAAEDVSPLTIADVVDRAEELPRGVVPADARALAVACDVGMYALHWVALARRANDASHVVDYGTIGTGIQKNHGDETQRRSAAKYAVPEAARKFVALALGGWLSAEGKKTMPGLGLVDANYLPDEVHAVVAKANAERAKHGVLWFPYYGRGESTLRDGRSSSYASAKKPLWKGTQCHLVRHGTRRELVMFGDADHYKAEVHDAVRATAGEPGSLTLFADTSGRGHETYASHLAAEQLEQRQNERPRWVRAGANHYLDATYMALIALAYLLAVTRKNDPPAAEAKTAPRKTTWGRRPYLATER